MSYTLKVPDNLAEIILSWRLPVPTLDRLRRAVVAPELVNPPFTALKTVDSVQGVYRWTFSDEAEGIRIDFMVAMNEQAKSIEAEQCWCVQTSGVRTERIIAPKLSR